MTFKELWCDGRWQFCQTWPRLIAQLTTIALTAMLLVAWVFVITNSELMRLKYEQWKYGQPKEVMFIG